MVTGAEGARDTGGDRASSLPPPGMPADWGLTPLGVIMELAGMSYLVLGLTWALMALLAAMSGGGLLWLGVVFGVGAVVRSDLHRRAGRALVYGREGGAMKPFKAYLVVAILHSLAAPLLIEPLVDVGDAIPWVTLVAWLAGWPVTIGLVVRRTPLWRSQGDQIPIAEDNGYESMAVLMTVMGGLGLLLSVAFTVGALTASSGGERIALGAACAMLLYRSVLHVRTGLAGLRGVSTLEFEERGITYSNRATVIAVLVGLVMFLAMLIDGAPPIFALTTPVAVFWVLLVWPRVVAEFLRKRSYAHFIDGAGQALGRAPDLGVTAIGWLLLGCGAVGLAGSLAALLSAPIEGGELVLIGLGADEVPEGLGRALALLGATLAQVWAGLEIVRMTPRIRIATRVYAAVGVAATLLVRWDQLALLDDLGLHALTPRGGTEALDALLLIVPSLLMPVAALVCANRRSPHAPRAVAYEA